MASVIGVPAVFVNDATPAWLQKQATCLPERTTVFAKEMATLKSESERRYLQLLKAALIKN